MDQFPIPRAGEEVRQDAGEEGDPEAVNGKGQEVQDLREGGGHARHEETEEGPRQDLVEESFVEWARETRAHSAFLARADTFLGTGPARSPWLIST